MMKKTALLAGIGTISIYASPVRAMMHDGMGGMGGGMAGSGYGYGYGIGAAQLFFWLLILAVIVGLAYYLIKDKNVFQKKGDALEILKERYARGEITREEFLEMKKELGER